MVIVNVDLSEYDAIRKRNSELEGWYKEDTFRGQVQDLYDLLDTTIREFDDENEMTNVPDRIFFGHRRRHTRWCRLR